MCGGGGGGLDSVERWRRMIGECRRSLNSFDAEIDMAIFVGRDTGTETQIVAQNSVRYEVNIKYTRHTNGNGSFSQKKKKKKKKKGKT